MRLTEIARLAEFHSRFSISALLSPPAAALANSCRSLRVFWGASPAAMSRTLMSSARGGLQRRTAWTRDTRKVKNSSFKGSVVIRRDSRRCVGTNRESGKPVDNLVCVTISCKKRKGGLSKYFWRITGLRISGANSAAVDCQSRPVMGGRSMTGRGGVTEEEIEGVGCAFGVGVGVEVKDRGAKVGESDSCVSAFVCCATFSAAAASSWSMMFVRRGSSPARTLSGLINSCLPVVDWIAANSF